jgi:hypothetical protein
MADNSSISSTNKIVTFNVGGTRYEVSRSLLNQFPNSMLCKSASEQWQEDPDSEIFIERDGARFKYVLDYMRDGKVDVPITQTQASILAELKYFGIDVVDNESGNVSKAITRQGIHYAHFALQPFEEYLRELDRDIMSRELAFKMLNSKKWVFCPDYTEHNILEMIKNVDVGIMRGSNIILKKIGLRIVGRDSGKLTVQLTDRTAYKATK